VPVVAAAAPATSLSLLLLLQQVRHDNCVKRSFCMPHFFTENEEPMASPYEAALPWEGVPCQQLLQLL
jgi:hypothetical protein